MADNTLDPLHGIARSSSTKPLTIPANSVLSIPQYGVRFYIVEADSFDLLYIKTDKTPEEGFGVGTGKEFDAGQFFSAIEIRNPTATDIRITFFAGFGNYLDKRTTIVGNRLSSIMPTMDSVSKSFGSGFANVGAASAREFDGVPDPAKGQIRRKSIQVTNFDASVALYLRDEDGENVLGIPGGTSALLYDSGWLDVYNAAGAAVSCTISETWYVKP